MATLARRPPEPLRRAAGALLSHEGVLALILIASLAVLATQTDRFLTTGNLLNQGRLMAEVGLVALPMTLVIVTGGIDLSVGSILGLCAILLGRALAEPRPAAAARDGARGAGRRPRRRLQRLVHHPRRRAAADHDARDAGAVPRPRRGHQPGALGARLPRLVLRARPGRGPGRADPALAPARGDRRSPRSLLARTTFGRSLYAIGHNQIAARFSGIPVDRTSS